MKLLRFREHLHKPVLKTRCSRFSVEKSAIILFAIMLSLCTFTACGSDDDDDDYSKSDSSSPHYNSEVVLDIFYTYIDVANADTTLLSNVEITQWMKYSDGTSSSTDTVYYEKAKATFYFDGEEVAELTSSPYSFEYDLSGFSSGKHSVNVDVITYDEDGKTENGTSNYDTSFLVLKPGAIDFEIKTSRGYAEDGSYRYAYLSMNSSTGLEKIYSVTYYWDGELLAETDSYSEEVTLPTISLAGHTLQAVVLLEATASNTTLFYFTITN